MPFRGGFLIGLNIPPRCHLCSPTPAISQDGKGEFSSLEYTVRHHTCACTMLSPPSQDARKIHHDHALASLGMPLSTRL
ncbi:hypothetical protein PISMIDRAFT_18259 [Pisolithus microcarpus 441]|uniref:Uncharacterized protein n=1 Tax=Pisolithus microcarpus 441 TaxID=765257 RepID=A0A0C9XL85_9AGAM|nr:hypothetical protein PISMIDRAFT_18259 [Pisolithus microcarpus 441]